ncbi:MAG: hypothetical protein O7J95_18735 [Planctomycetota bacterium]|nr:hypothetical protein [Planctomycetota bacterium]
MLILVVFAAGCRLEGEPHSIARESALERYLAESPDRPGLVVDVDDTLVDGGLCSKIRLFLNLFPSLQAPFDDAPRVLTALEERWNLVLLTSRDDFYRARTLKWLDRQVFPRVPVVFSRRVLFTAASRAEFKRQAIEALMRRGLRLRRGVGDKASDIDAYGRNGLLAILILDGHDDADLPRTLETLGIDSWTPGDASAGPLEMVCFSRRTGWTRIAEHLRRD